ncbi:hypothetical protein FF36_01807 [Frankia torreyi]|uniref:WxL domain-containing protein n=1 Tax=Frankia torreyi TaxID=1856 RepID=A0A0D8BIP9_9ACTN|nr:MULTISPECIES: hypothetical protein [Frankia]KJE23874.1 hypothetical protein FF36_01807 [Frankia torreyi]KQM05783.1 hypothetical protein FF86_101368 [Frankia sp. CpI1-P]
MRKSSLFLLSAAAAAAALLGSALPANAATADTVVTLTLTGGAVNITAPATATLTGAIGTTPVSGPLGLVTVTDTEGTEAPSWVASVSTTNFNAPVGSGIAPIPVANIHYSPGTVTRVNNTGTANDANFTGEFVAVPTVTATGGPGINSASWNPTLTVDIPPTAVAGTNYTATITHSTVP